jgi:hypothetical protein
LLSVREPREDPHLTAAVLQGLKEAGFVDGRNPLLAAIKMHRAPNKLES